MLTPAQQRAVWEGWLGAEIRAYYFADLGYRYQHQQTIVTWVLLVCATGAFGALVTDWLPVQLAWVRAVLACATAALSVWSAIARNWPKVSACADLHFRWNTLATKYEALWDHWYEADADTTLQQIKQVEAEISKASTAFPNDAARMGKWQDLVEAHHQIPRQAA